VDDVAGVIAELPASCGTVEIGGPEVLSIEDLLLRMRRAGGVTNRRVMHLPLSPIVACLVAVEPFLRPLMPVTAGQLASFANAGTAEPDPFVTARQGSMCGIEEMISVG
jgi:hypothetical protein